MNPVNRHQFHAIAKQFRAGRITINEFADRVLGPEGSTSEGAGIQKEPVPASLDTMDCPALPVRADDSHKGSFGHVVVIAGSRSMPGAAALTGLAAARSGCGLVTIATSNCAAAIVAGFSPCLMVRGFAQSAEGMIDEQSIDDILELLLRATVVVIGPGLGQGDSIRSLVARVYSEVKLPVIVDADGLNGLASLRFDLSKHAGPRILTPHIGELRRILAATRRDTGDEVPHNGEELQGFAARNDVTLVAKSHKSVVVNAAKIWRSTRSTSGLATAGSGDVLGGIIAGLIAQGMSPVEGAAAGCNLHLECGLEAASRLGAASVIATDLIDSIPAAYRKLNGNQ